MTSKELVKQTIEQWGFPILQDEETALVTRFQMSYIQISGLQDDSKGIAVTLTGLFKAEDERQLRLALKACNELNYRMMQVKLYFDDDNDLVIASEFFYVHDDDVESLLNLALQAVVTTKKRFINKYDEIEAEDRLIQEINEQE